MTHIHLLHLRAHHWKTYYFKQQRRDRITSKTDTENIWDTLVISDVKEYEEATRRRGRERTL